MLYLRTVQDKYIALYRELITQLHIYATSIKILVKGYLPISFVTSSKLREILNNVKTAIWKTNPDNDSVIDRLHLYYDMQLVTLPVPIIDQNMQAQSYMHLQVNKSYIALNSKTYISIRQQELRTCKRIGHEFYC